MLNSCFENSQMKSVLTVWKTNLSAGIKKDEVTQKLHIVKRKKKSKNTHNARNSICIYNRCVSFYKGTLCKRLKEFYRVFCVYLREILFFSLSSANRTLSKFFLVLHKIHMLRTIALFPSSFVMELFWEKIAVIAVW